MAPPALATGLSLIPHPDTPCAAIRAITVSAARNQRHRLDLRFRLTGDIGRLSIPSPLADAGRSDGLWRTSCVEAFAGPVGGPAYCEFNFAPSTAWAAYQFKAWRQPVAPPRLDAPAIEVESTDDEISIAVAVDTSSLPLLPPDEPWQLAVAAVIEETDGTKSYWALRHPPGPPDFHHRDCFQLTLGAPDRA